MPLYMLVELPKVVPLTVPSVPTNLAVGVLLVAQARDMRFSLGASLVVLV